MEPTKVLVIGHSIVRRFHEFLINDEDIRLPVNMGLSATHIVYFKGTGGCKIDGILRNDAQFIRDTRPDHLVLMIRGNDVRRTSSPEELSSQILSLVSVLHSRFLISTVPPPVQTKLLQ